MRAIYTRKYIILNYSKPIYANAFGVREKYIWDAKRTGRLLKITTPLGTTITNPQKYLEDAQRIEKVFLDSAHPMVLYVKNLVPDSKEPEDYFIQDYSPTGSIMERLREKAIEQGWYKKSGAST